MDILKEVKVTTPEYLSNDILEDDFIRTFYGLYRLQYILGSCRIYVKNRFATPPTAAQKCYTIICMLPSAASSYQMDNFYIKKMKSWTTLYLGLANTIILLAMYCLNIAHVRFCNNDKNVEFFISIQKIDRLLQIDQWKLLNEWVRFITNAPVVLLIIVFFGLVVLACAEEGLIFLLYLGMLYFLLTLLVEITACSSVIAFFIFRIRYVNSLMENYLKAEILPQPKISFFQLEYINNKAQEMQNKYETSDMHAYLREIFKCFTMYQDLYKFQLFIFCLQSVLSSIFSFELIIYSIRQNETTLIEISLFIILTVVDVLTAVFLGVRYEVFFNEVRGTKRLCINIMAKHHEGPLREKARKMLYMIEETPPRFSVYEMWEMNASTFVAMFSLITSVIVTLLQFAFL